MHNYYFKYNIFLSFSYTQYVSAKEIFNILIYGYIKVRNVFFFFVFFVSIRWFEKSIVDLRYSNELYFI